MEQLQWIRERTWARFLFYAVIIGLLVDVLTFAFLVFRLFAGIIPVDSMINGLLYVAFYLIVAVSGSLLGSLPLAALLLFMEQSVQSLNSRLIQRYKRIELETFPMAEADSVGLLKIYNPLQWIPPTIVRYMQPPNWVPWLCFVENRPVAALGWGETVTIPLPTGRYEVCVGKWMLSVTEKFPERKLDFTQTV